MEIALARVDDRMIHGQVVTSWVRAIGRVDRILVCDDQTSQDTFLQTVLRQLAPPGVPVEVKSVEDTIATFEQGAGDTARVLLLTRAPDSMLRLIEAGIDIVHVNIGGIGMGPGRKTLHRNVAVSDDELASLRAIEGRGVEVEVRMVPGDKRIALADLAKDR